LKLEYGKPYSFFVLYGNYSSEGPVWNYPVGIHFIKGIVSTARIVCTEVTKGTPCYICEQLAEMRARAENTYRFEGPAKYAMNILVRGEEIPRVFVAPATVAAEIRRVLMEGVEAGIDFLDPKASVAWSVIRSKQDGETRFTTTWADELEPIITGDDMEAHIERIIQSGVKLDQKFKLPGPGDATVAWASRLP
jgi:hypothetical protein